MSEQLPEHIEQDIAEQERTLRALEREQETGRSLLSPERLSMMRQALEEKKRHLYDRERRGDRVSATPEEQEQFRMTLSDVERRAVQYEQDLKVLRKYADDSGVRQTYDRVRHKMLNLRDRFEDLSQTIPADSPVRMRTNDAEQRIKDIFLRMLQESSPVRDMHRQVTEAYATVSHTLSEDQRRSYRQRIAQLSALVRQAEGEQAPVKKSFFKGPAFVRAVASLASARATAAAQAIADAMKLK